MSVLVYGYAHMSMGAQRGQKKLWCPLELELQRAVSCQIGSCPMWVLGTKLGSSAKAIVLLTLS